MSALKYLPGLFKTAALTIASSLALTVWAAPPYTSATNAAYPAVPPNISSSSGSKPMMMIATSKDHTLFGPIYTDFEDLEGDGKINTTFQPTFKYYGYFDPAKCYIYQNQRFEPSALATAGAPAATAINGGSISTSGSVTTFTVTTHGSGNFTTGLVLGGVGVLPNTYITDYGTGSGGVGTYIVNNDYSSAAVTSQTIAGTGSKYTCGGTGQWSGNFLNWATMTRMDVVRKLLYGGKRSTDTGTETVLERANLSKDSHSFTKHYYGADIRDYTPFTVANLTKSSKYVGLTICSRSDTMGEGGTPVIRLAKGNYRMWSTVEGTVCEWGTSSNNFGTKLQAYFIDGDKGAGVIPHEANVPVESTDGATYGGVGPELKVRVKVCVASLLSAEERCQAYPPGSLTNYKPFGLFQEFGASQASGAAKAEFGVISGSYDNNLTAGALRKNMGDFEDEINGSTGVFCHATSSGCATTTTDGRATGNGAIKAIDAFVLYGRNGSNYDGSNVQLPSEMTDGTLSAWGNPIGEMIIQSLQYYAGGTSTNPSSTAKDTAKGLPVQTWTDPLSDSNTIRKGLYGKAICRPMYNLALSSSALSFDGQGATPFATLPNRASGTLAAYTNLIGDAEGLSGSANRSVGSVSGGFGETCSGKTIGTLSDVSGVCPDAPGIGGAYHLAGAALYANTSKIKTITSPPSDLVKVQDALKVKTMTASLSGGSARIDVLIPSSNPKKYVYITPESLWAANYDAKKMPGAMLTFNSINYKTYVTTAANAMVQTGTFVVTWNDSQFGGDYDMDIAGFIRYDVLYPSALGQPYKIKVTTDILNVGAGWTGSHGFSIIGVTKTTNNSNANGRYLTHRHLTSDSVLSGSEGYLCGNSAYRNLTSASAAYNGIHTAPDNNQFHCDTSSGWNAIRTTSSRIESVFNMVGAENALVNDPLWYAAKYGSFTSSTKNPDGTFTEVAMPTAVASWDKVSAIDGTQVSDGIPDAYYLARRPDQLEDQLRKALSNIVGKSNSSPATSSTSIQEGSFKYISNFNKDEFYGTVEAKPLLSTGQFSEVATWDAGMKLTTVASTARTVVTNDGNTGVGWQTSTSFTSGFSSALLGSASTTLTSTQGDQLINYLRGDRTQEMPVGIWRKRKGDVNATDSNVMGMVVNSTPWLQTIPVAENIGALPSGAPSYASFITAQKARDALLWVGSNDGMLHGFKATGSDAGAPVMSYVPSPMVGRLGSLAQGSTILAGMDGSPFTGDVLVGSSTSALWKTYLFSSLGRGGRAVFALDVTTPSALTEVNASSIYKWMFSSTDDADLGYIISEYQKHPISKQASPVVRMNNGKYAILVPNGIGSASGRAYLYVLFVDGPGSGAWTVGTHYIKIPTDALGSNGLMGANWADTNNNGTADLIYGTDLLGRVWKFDVSSVTPTDWKSAFLDSGSNPIPLFEAKSGTDRLSITTSPVLTAPDFGGIMVHFGTGRAISSGDFPDSTKTQRAITVYDRFNWTTPSPRPLPNSNLSTMHKFTLKRASSTGKPYILAGGNVMFDKLTEDGYYHDFPSIATTGTDTKNNEMVLSSLVFAGGEIKGKTVRPNPDQSSYCDPAPMPSDFSFNPLTGLPTGQSGTVDVLINGVLTPVYAFGGSSLDQKSTVVLKINGKAGTWATLGANELKETPTFLVPSRRQWREIPGMRSDQ